MATHVHESLNADLPARQSGVQSRQTVSRQEAEILNQPCWLSSHADRAHRTRLLHEARTKSWSTWTRTRTNRTKICCAADYTIDQSRGRCARGGVPFADPRCRGLRERPPNCGRDFHATRTTGQRLSRVRWHRNAREAAAKCKHTPSCSLPGLDLPSAAMGRPMNAPRMASVPYKTRTPSTVRHVRPQMGKGKV